MRVAFLYSCRSSGFQFQSALPRRTRPLFAFASFYPKKTPHWEASNQAFAAADTRFEPDNTRHSRKAIANLLPLMEQGIPYSTARKEKYGEALEATEALDELPPVKPSGTDREGAFPSLRNPAVERAMSELRKVVNAILKRTGKRPHTIRVELARDLKHARNRRVSEQRFPPSHSRR